MLDVKVNDSEIRARLKVMPEKVQAKLLRASYILAAKMENKIKTEKLSGQVLKKGTGNLMRSIRNKVVSVKGESVTGIVFSRGDVKYAGIHEYGGVTRPHIIEPKKKEALSFMMGGKEVFFKKVNHPGSKIPMRSYMRSTLKEMQPQIVAGLKAAVLEGVRS